MLLTFGGHGPAPLAEISLRSSFVGVGALLVAWFVLNSNAIFPLLEMGSGLTLSEDSMARLRWLQLINLTAAVLLFLTRTRCILALLGRNPVLVLLLLWIWSSVFWSVDPDLSARRALAFTANVMIASFVVTYFSPAQIVQNLLRSLLGLVMLSIVFAAILPELAFMPEDGALRGVFTHKNGMGSLLVLAALALTIAGRARLMSQVGLVCGWLVVVAMLIPTGSATAVMVVALVTLLQIPLAIARLPRRQATITLTLCVLAVAALALPLLLGRNRIFIAIGRDPTLTGRTELWAFVQGLIDQRPLLGYGYQAFFDLPGVKEQVLAIVGWPAPNAHNGYLEVWLGLGLIGLVLSLVFLLGAFVRATYVLTNDPRSTAACFTYFTLAIFLFRNFSESELLQQTTLSSILAVLAALGLGAEPQVRRVASTVAARVVGGRA